MGFWKGWDYIFSKLNVLPDNLEAASQSCGISASQNLETSYCYELKEIKIGGVKQHANCDYLESQAAFTAWEKPCDAIKVKNAAIALCTNNPKLSATYKINTWTCGDLRPTTTPAA